MIKRIEDLEKQRNTDRDNREREREQARKLR